MDYSAFTYYFITCENQDKRYIYIDAANLRNPTSSASKIITLKINGIVVF